MLGEESTLFVGNGEGCRGSLNTTSLYKRWLQGVFLPLHPTPYHSGCCHGLSILRQSNDTGLYTDIPFPELNCMFLFQTVDKHVLPLARSIASVLHACGIAYAVGYLKLRAVVMSLNGS